MASTPSAPLRPVHHNGSRDFGVRLPDINEAIMVRLPFEVTLGPPSIISTNAVTNANGSNYHLCIVSGRVVHRDPSSIQLDVWVCLGFSSAVPNSHAFVRSLSAEWQECLLPIPYGPQTPSLDPLPTPAGFGEPLRLGGFLTRKPCYLNIRPVPIRLTAGAPFKRFQPPGILSDEEVTRLEMYALRVPRLVLPITHHHHHHHPGGNSNPPGGSGAATHPPVPAVGPQYASAPAPPPPAPATAGGSASASPAPHGVQTHDLLDLWYPELKEMVCADDGSTCSGCAGEERDGLSWLQYARLFAGSSEELRRVVEEHEAMQQEAVEEKVGGWLRAMADVYVR